MALTSVRRLLCLAPSAALATALLVGCGGGESAPDETSPSSTAAASPAPSSAPTEVTPEEYCDSFLSFVDANSEFGSRLDSSSGQALVDAARTMFESPTPLEMTAGARAGMDQLVQGTLAQLAGVPEVSVDTAPDPQYAAEPDATELDLYLQDTCPA